MVKFVPKEANLALLTGRCISIMHGYIGKHDIKGLGVSFPAWSDKSIGNVIAFVHSNANYLNGLQSQSYFQDMKDSGCFSLTNVEAVPDSCGEVRFKRNQSVAKLFAGEARRRLRRLEKRASERGETFNPSKKSEAKEVDVFHRIAISSLSSKQDYLLHIQKNVPEKQTEPEFNSYGFATNHKFNGTVPDLSILHDNV